MCGLQSNWAILQSTVYLCTRSRRHTPLPIFLARHAKILGFSELLCIGLVADCMICVDSRWKYFGAGWIVNHAMITRETYTDN